MNVNNKGSHVVKVKELPIKHVVIANLYLSRLLEVCFSAILRKCSMLLAFRSILLVKQ